METFIINEQLYITLSSDNSISSSFEWHDILWHQYFRPTMKIKEIKRFFLNIYYLHNLV